jgi:hypothetical protein
VHDSARRCYQETALPLLWHMYSRSSAPQLVVWAVALPQGCGNLATKPCMMVTSHSGIRLSLPMEAAECQQGIAQRCQPVSQQIFRHNQCP